MFKTSSAIDLSAAFDTVDNDILLSRLHERFGITGIPLLWFQSYLSSRMQYVSVDGGAFLKHALQCGVPKEPPSLHLTAFRHCKEIQLELSFLC